MVLYSAFADTIDSRTYYDIVVAYEGLALVPVGSLPLVPKHRAPLPRSAEMLLLRIAKDTKRRSYSNIEELIKRKRALFIPQDKIVCCTLREREIPIPPLLRKPPRSPREKPKSTERALELAILLDEPSGVRCKKYYTTIRLKDAVKRALKEVGLYIPPDLVTIA